MLPFRTQPRLTLMIVLLLALMLTLGLTIAARSQPAPVPYEHWPLLQNPFESTGGGGIMIDGYQPVVTGQACATPFTATTPEGQVYRNIVTFDAVPVAGGILCTNGRWRALEGDASGTTPFQVFIKDGVMRRTP